MSVGGSVCGLMYFPTLNSHLLTRHEDSEYGGPDSILSILYQQQIGSAWLHPAHRDGSQLPVLALLRAPLVQGFDNVIYRSVADCPVVGIFQVVGLK